jgi:pyruvate/2-oxoglutarate dehydrogenase complex dihydrolipoamide acyltransferase (E2) component
MFEFILPDIGEGISEALLINWTISPGDQIEEDQLIATISTDKVDVELPSPRAGTVKELCWQPGDTVQVGSIFMRLETDGDDDAVAPQPVGVEKEKRKSSAPAKAQKPAVSDPPPAKSDKVIAAPSTRKLAADKGIDLNTISGSGDDGRILRKDLESSQPQVSGTPRREAPSGVRATMAERMGYSVQTLAHSTLNFEVAADGLLDLQHRLAPAAEIDGLKLSISVIIAKCVAAALTRHPRFNATIDEEARGLLLHDAVHLGLALASDRGLTVPVLRDVQDKSLFALARQLADTVARGRDNKLQATDYRDGTFTLSNTGALETASFLSARPVINAPQTAILWVSRIRNRPRVIDDELEAGPMINCSLSFDHRFIDGADGIAFINDIAALFEIPEQALAAE